MCRHEGERRTAVAANDEGATGALSVAFYGGSIMGSVSPHWASLVWQFVLLFGGDPKTAHAIHGFGRVLLWSHCSRVSVVVFIQRVPTSVRTQSVRSRQGFLKMIPATRRHR